MKIKQNKPAIIMYADVLTNLLVNKKHRNIFRFKKPAMCIDPAHKNCFNCEWGGISYSRCSYPDDDYFAVRCYCKLGHDIADRAEKD